MSKSQYTITITNRCSSTRSQTYSLFSHPPQVTGPVQGRIWPVVISQLTVPPTQSGTFKVMSKYYQGLCGQLGQADTTTNGSDLTVTAHDMRAVSLGEKKIDGSRTAGTTLSMNLSTHDQKPTFTRHQPPAAADAAGTFEILTGDNFSSSQALEGNYTIGLGVYPRATPRASPSACFIPEPNAKYTIKPSHVYYVVVRTNNNDNDNNDDDDNTNSLQVGHIVDPEILHADSEMKVYEVDFRALRDGLLSVDLVHDNDNNSDGGACIRAL